MYSFDSERRDVAFSEATPKKFKAANNKDNQNQDRPNLQEAAKEVIRALGKEPSPHQILVENLAYDDFAGFKNTKEKKALVPKDLAIEWSLLKGDPWKARRGQNKKQDKKDEEDGTEAETAEAEGGEMGDSNGGDKVELIIPLSLSVYTNIQSSISFLYKECRIQMLVKI
jgi:hypothetical protein